jgi:hypothetical protein
MDVPEEWSKPKRSFIALSISGLLKFQPCNVSPTSIYLFHGRHTEVVIRLRLQVFTECVQRNLLHTFR